MQKRMRMTISALLITVLTIAAAALVLSSCKMGGNNSPASIAFKEPYISKQPESISFKPSQYLSASHTLKIEIDDWDDENGILSFQWYSFTDAGEYLANHEQGNLIPGANKIEYTLPNNLNTTEGSRYYYYVEVTNTNPKATNGKTTGTIRSSIVTVAFTKPGESDIPRIIVAPADAEYTYGDTMLPLTVTAQVSSGTLSYQWYTGDIKNGTKISGATLATYELDLYTMQAGDNYYWVVITNSEPGSLPSTTTSFPTIITLIWNLYSHPVITQQPNDLLYLIGGSSPGGITVEATSPDSGVLGYQWYSNTTESNSGGTPIMSATNKTYTPTVNTTSTGTFYYYVIVSNTSDYGINITTTTSNVATLRVRSPSTATSNATVTILDPAVADNRYQYIRGYGTADVAWDNFPETSEADTERMYSPDGLGYNILRIMIVPPGNNDWDYKNHAELVQKLLDNHRPDYLNNVKVVNKYGGYVLATPWSPPKEWKTNYSINSGGSLIPECYGYYANYLKDFARYMYNQGAPIYALSIQNEPNYDGGYDGCNWTVEQMRDFWKQVGHFTDGVPGYGGGMSTPVVLTMNGESANIPRINDATLNDPVSRAAVDLYGRHVYGAQTETLWTNQYADWREGSPYQTECWMTEHNINSASPTAFPNDSTWNYVWRFMNDVDLTIRLNNENAFIWWAGKRFYSMIGDGGVYGTTDGEILPRGWGLSHYAKYTIDKTRLGVSVSERTLNGTPITENSANSIVNSTNFSLDSLSVKITAYVSKDGNEIAMIMWTPTNTSGSGGYDMGTINIDMPDGFTIGGVSAHKSSSGHYMEAEEVEVSANRQSAFVTLPASTILSVRFTKAR